MEEQVSTKRDSIEKTINELKAIMHEIEVKVFGERPEGFRNSAEKRVSEPVSSKLDSFLIEIKRISDIAKEIRRGLELL